MKKMFTSIVMMVLALGVASTAWADSSALAASLANSVATSGSQAAANQGNNQVLNFNSPASTQSTVNSNGTLTTNHTGNIRHEQVGTSTVKTVPQVYAPPMGVTSPCRIAFSGGVSIVGVGASGGGSVADAPCNLRELARLYHGVGAPAKAVLVADAALALECNDETVAKALGNMCPKPAETPIVTPVAAAPAAAVTPAGIPAVASPPTVQPASQAIKPQAAAAKNCVVETTASGIKTTTCSG